MLQLKIKWTPDYWCGNVLPSVSLGGITLKGAGLYILCLFMVYLMTIVKSASVT
jgi:hypothetical protein